MAEFGYDSEAIAVGKQKYVNCRQTYDLNKREDQESRDSFALIESKRNKLIDDYKLHRKKAKIVFRKNAGTLIKLQIDGRLPRSYLKLVEMMKVFYSTLYADENMKTAIAKLNVSQEQLTGAIALMNEVETARVDYLCEVGESQDTTKHKDAAFAIIDDWMHEFYAVAHIALEDHPQLLEALGLVIKS